MDPLRQLLDQFVEQSRQILGMNLAGVYLHGSAAMGCFREEKSDIDLLVVVNRSLTDQEKWRYMDMVVGLNEHAPKKGIEMSIVKRSVCRPFIYPTPFELHFSIMHLEWYRKDPHDYIENMKGTDKDLAVHMMVIYHRGQCLYGGEINDVFEEVSREEYFNSIWHDIENAREDIIENPVYMTLNLCRVLAYKKEGLILSKQEGGRWGLKNVPEAYHMLIRQALEDYTSVRPMKADERIAAEYADYMLEQIEKTI